MYSVLGRSYLIIILVTTLLAGFQFGAAPVRAEVNTPAQPSAGIEIDGEQAFVYVTTGLNKTRIVTDSAKALTGPFASNVALAPDGKKLLYVSLSDTDQPEVTIWRVNTDGSERQALALLPLQRLWTAPFVWSPDSSRIAYILQTAGGQIELWRMAGDGSNKERLLEQNSTFRPEMFQGDNRTALKWSSEGNFLELTDRTATPNLKHVLDLTAFKITSIAVPAQAPAGSRRINLPLFTQTDPQWKNDYLGCGTTIGSQGCALTSTAMVFKYFGVNTNPKLLKNCLGYRACPINWGGAGSACSEGKVSGGEIRNFDFNATQDALARGLPVIVGFQVNTARTHFVVITGGSGTDAANYSVVDPWDASSTKSLKHFMVTLGWPNQMNIFVGTPPSTTTYTPAQGSSRLPAMIEAYNRNGGSSSFGAALNTTHWWFGAVIQDFSGDPAALVQDEALENDKGLAPGTCRAFAVRRGLFNWYTGNGNPAAFGTPTSDEYAADGIPQQSFAKGYILFGATPTFTAWPEAGEGWRTEYFNSSQLACRPGWVTYEKELNIDHDWSTRSPHPALMKDGWSVRYTREQALTGGAYKIEGESDKEVRVWLDNQLIIERKPGQTGGAIIWSGQLAEGLHRFQVEYYGGAGKLRLTLAENSGPAVKTRTAPDNS